MRPKNSPLLIPLKAPSSARSGRLISQANNIQVPHKRCVKYLGIHLDDLLRYNQHVKIQIEKAKKAFRSLHGLFYSPYLSKKAKTIAYLTIIRPIITYGCPIWWNVSACTMERLRLFERRILRACLGKYRSAVGDYQMMISNANILKEAEIPRIDSFMIKLIRNYIKKSIRNKTNSLIFGPYYFKQNYFEAAIGEGFVPPEGFQYLDNLGYIMREESKPVLYHYPRDNRNKRILFDPDKISNQDMVYCRHITKYDKQILEKFSYYSKIKSRR